MTPSETATSTLRKRRKATVSADRLRSASAAPIGSPVALASGMRMPTWRSPARSISKGASAWATCGIASAPTSAGSLGPSEDTATIYRAHFGDRRREQLRARMERRMERSANTEAQDDQGEDTQPRGIEGAGQ